MRGRTTRHIAAVIGAGALALGLGACGLTAASGEVDGVSSSSLPPCPASLSHTSRFVVLTTDSIAERSKGLQAERLAAIGTFAEQAASCRGQLSVVFDPGETTTTTLWSGTPYQSAGTEIAFERRSAEYVTSVIMPAVSRALSKALSSRPPSSSTPLGAFEALSEIAGGQSLDALVLSDFVEHDSRVDLNRPLTTEQAIGLARIEPWANLAGDHVEIEGVGVTNDSVPAPDDWLTALRAFALTSCRRTGAASCQVSTQVLP